MAVFSIELGSVLRRVRSSPPSRSACANCFKHMDFLPPSPKPTRWNCLKMPITFSTAHLFFELSYGYCYYRGELPNSWHTMTRDYLKPYFELYWWNEWLCSRVRSHYLQLKLTHLTSSQMLRSKSITRQT